MDRISEDGGTACFGETSKLIGPSTSRLRKSQKLFGFLTTMLGSSTLYGAPEAVI